MYAEPRTKKNFCPEYFEPAFSALSEIGEACLRCKVCDGYSDLSETIFGKLGVIGKLDMVEIREMWFINRIKIQAC